MAGEADRALAVYLRQEVAAHSAHHRERLAPVLDASGSGVDRLGLVPLMVLADVANPAELVLRPNWASLGATAGGGRRALRRGRRRRGRRGRRNRMTRAMVEHRYKPVNWVIQAGLPVGSSAADLDRLGDIGRRWLELAGVSSSDVLVSLAPPGPHLSYWQLVLGARQAGVSAIHLPPIPAPAQVARFQPSVLAGRPFDLARLLEAALTAGRPLSRVRTVLALGEPLEAGMRARLASLLDPVDSAVVASWAPPGVRALWGECRGAVGLHTWPEAEVIQIVDPLSGEPVPAGADGEVVWTSLGWLGSVFVRLRTGVFASVVDGPCPSCDSTSPRLLVTSGVPAFLAVLDAHGGVAGWQAELRHVDSDEELVVFLVPAPKTRLGPLLGDLDADLSATQYVVVDAATLDERIAAHGDRRVVDLRA